MNQETIKQMIKTIIVNDLDVGIKDVDVNDEISLYDDGLGLDSISIINFIVLLEKKFEVRFNEKEISPDLFRNINNLSQFLNTKLEVKVSA